MMDFTAFENRRICVAVSGGVDSVSLLHYLKAREKEYGYSLLAVHCEHGIRGAESLQDMAFVQTLCKEWDIPLYTFAENCIEKAEREKLSLETAARVFRYESFSRLIQGGKADYIALAHHQNDEAETVLFRLARGTSLAGVGGMSVLNGYLLRPFLAWSRSEIEEYARENKLSYCVDKTNLETKATRNKLRLQVLPLLEAAVPGATENVARFAALAAEDDALLQAYAKELLTVEDAQIHVRFCAQKPLFRRASLAALKMLGVEHDYTAQHLECVYLLQNCERGKKLDLPQNTQAKKTDSGIVFYKKAQMPSIEKPTEKPFSEEGFQGGMYEVIVSQSPINMQENAWKVLRLDGDSIPSTAVFRFRKEGDRIQRFGGGTKSLKKFFNEAKIDVEKRDYLPLIAEKDSTKVYAVCGVEISEKVKVTEKTKNILYITVKDYEDTNE